MEKEGYTYGQREAEIVKERSTATNAIYLTPIDSAVTPCGPAGCSHTSSDGMLQVVVPPGAIPAGQTLDVTATNFEQVEFLPSGELPPGTWETYAFNLSGDSGATFAQPVTVRTRNTIGFESGTQIPLGFWNEATQQWEHAGIGTVDASGQWMVTTVTNFSNYDINAPVSPGNSGATGSGGGDGCQGLCCLTGGAKEKSCEISLGSGALGEDISLPAVDVMGESIGPQLLYSTNRADPSGMVDFTLTLNPQAGVQLGNYVGFDLYVQDQKVDSYSFGNSVLMGEVGRFRYLWDGRDAQGQALAAGVHEFEVKFRIPYRAQYCRPFGDIFGNPPYCGVGGATNRFVDAVETLSKTGTLKLNTQSNNAFGAGWVLADQERLYQNDAGQISVASGYGPDAE